MTQLISTAILLAAFAQTPALPQFDAASIKPSETEPGAESGLTTTPGRLVGRNVTLKRCIRGAYNVDESRIFGGPKWIEEARFRIDAKATGPAGDRELMVMLQSLLAERFKLAFHRETKTLPGYSLVLGKGGLNARPSAPGTDSRGISRSNTNRKSIEAQACSMNQLAMKLAEALHLPVADSTGIQGEYDFKLEWTPEDPRATAPADPAAGPTLFAALQEQLGLKLQAGKVPVEVLVIDRAEKPPEN